MKVKIKYLLKSQSIWQENWFMKKKCHCIYRTRAIISRGLYTFYPISKDHLCTMTFGLMYGQYSRAASSQERPMMARVRQMKQANTKLSRCCIKLSVLRKQSLCDTIPCTPSNCFELLMENLNFHVLCSNVTNLLCTIRKL